MHVKDNLYMNLRKPEHPDYIKIALKLPPHRLCPSKKRAQSNQLILGRLIVANVGGKAEGLYLP